MTLGMFPSLGLSELFCNMGVLRARAVPCTGISLDQAQDKCSTSSSPHSGPMTQVLLLSLIPRWGN